MNREKIKTQSQIFSLCSHFYLTSNMWPNTQIASYMSIFFHAWNWLRFKGFPWWLSGKEFACQYRRYNSGLWVRKIAQSRKWQPNLEPVHGKCHGQRKLPMSHNESDMTGHSLLLLLLPLSLLHWFTRHFPFGNIKTATK